LALDETRSGSAPAGGDNGQVRSFAGRVRFSVEPFNTAEQIDETVEAIKKIAQYRRTR